MPHSRLQRPCQMTLRRLARATALAAAVAVATWIGLFLGRTTEIAAVWLPNGIILAMLLTAQGSGRRWERAGLLAAGLGASFATMVGTGRPTTLTACFMVVNLTEIVVAFALLRNRIGSRFRVSRPAHLFVSGLLGMGIAPLVSGACVFTFLDIYRVELLPAWWAGHALGLAITTPLTLMLAGRRNGLPDLKGRRIEAALLVGLALATVGLTFSLNELPLLSLPFAPLILVVLRFGAPGAAWVLPPTVLIAVQLTAMETGPMALLASADPINRLLTFHTYLASLVIALLPLGAVISQLQRRQLTLARRAATVRKMEDRMRQSEQLYRLLADNSSDIISRFTSDGRRTYVSPSVVDILGWSAEEMLSPDYKRYIHPDDVKQFQDVAEQMRAGVHRISNVYRYMRRDGSWAWLDARLILVHDDDGKPREFISNTRDITRQKEAENALAAAASELTELAATDALTGVANRRRFDEMLDREWRRAMRSLDELSLLLIDVDHFKGFNDQYGHLMGDTCLHAIATAIAGSVRRPGDLVARYGGEEFAVILPNTGGDGAVEIASRVRDGIAALAMPHLGNPGDRVTVSIGSANSMPNRSTDSSVLVEAADEALYEAKRLGRDRAERAPAIDMAEKVIRLKPPARR